MLLHAGRYPVVTLLPTGNIMIIANASSVLYTYSTTTHLLTQLPTAIPDIPHPTSYPYTASVIMLALSPTNNYNPQAGTQTLIPQPQPCTASISSHQLRP